MSKEEQIKFGRVKREGEDISGFSQIGQIRIGEKRKNAQGTEYPVSLDYFKSVGKYSAMFNEIYGDKPSTIQIIFISDTLQQSCWEEWEARDSSGKRAGYSNGMTYYLFNEAKQEYEPANSKQEVEKYSKEHNLKWAVVLTLFFIIPKIKGVFGVWKFQTKGNKSSIKTIRDTYDLIQKNVGTVVNIPFDLTVQKVKSQKPGSKNLFPVVNLTANLSVENMEIVHKFIESGQEFRNIGMLTDAKIEQMKVLPEHKATLTEQDKREIELKESELFKK